MPVFKKTIEYFTCKFKCGEKCKPLSTMEKHEAKCFCNPETRSCRICKHYIIDPVFVMCNIHEYEMDNQNTEIVTKKEKVIYNEREVKEKDKENRDIYYQSKARPFPKSNCMQFELGKKAY